MNGFYKDIIKDIRYFIRYATVPDTLNGRLQSPHYTVHLFNCHNRPTHLCPLDSINNNFTFRSELPATAELIEYSNTTRLISLVMKKISEIFRENYFVGCKETVDQEVTNESFTDTTDKGRIQNVVRELVSKENNIHIIQA